MVWLIAFTLASSDSSDECSAVLKAACGVPARGSKQRQAQAQALLQQKDCSMRWTSCWA